jgi:hypothetical protein
VAHKMEIGSLAQQRHRGMEIKSLKLRDINKFN